MSAFSLTEAATQAGAEKTVPVQCNNGRAVLYLQPGENLLTAATEQGFRLPRGCKNGVCEVCRCQLLQGEVFYRTPAGLQHAAAGDPFLFCSAYVTAPASIELGRVLLPGEHSVKTLACQIVSVEPLGASGVYRVQLQTPAGQLPDYSAGQYLELILPNGEKNAFSIANRPDGRRLELHIQHLPERENSRLLLSTLQQEKLIKAVVASGDVRLQHKGSEAVIFAAAGTGFSQMKALLEEALQCSDKGPDAPALYLYWAVRRQEELYLAELPATWQQQYANFRFVPVVAEQAGSSDHLELLRRTLIREHGRFEQACVYASGSPAMVYGLYDALTAAGLPEQQMFSDVFRYAPRESLREEKA